MVTDDRVGLCFRCDHRARFLETGHGPRCECGDVTSTKHSCYCYFPVLPVLMEVDEKDDRPRFAGSMLSAREHAVGLPTTKLCRKAEDCDVELRLQEVAGYAMLYWAPVERAENESEE